LNFPSLRMSLHVPAGIRKEWEGEASLVSPLFVKEGQGEFELIGGGMPVVGRRASVFYG
jgi:hypothetical protein